LKNKAYLILHVGVKLVNSIRLIIFVVQIYLKNQTFFKKTIDILGLLRYNEDAIRKGIENKKD